jgi:3-dehydroquinate synthetase
VAIGMAAESRLAEQLGVAEPGTAAQVAEALARAGLPTKIPKGLASDALLALTHGDKKVRAGRVEYALPRAIGAMAGGDSGWGIPVDDAAVLEALRVSGMISGC